MELRGLRAPRCRRFSRWRPISEANLPLGRDRNIRCSGLRSRRRLQFTGRNPRKRIYHSKPSSGLCLLVSRTPRARRLLRFTGHSRRLLCNVRTGRRRLRCIARNRPERRGPRRGPRNRPRPMDCVRRTRRCIDRRHWHGRLPHQRKRRPFRGRSALNWSLEFRFHDTSRVRKTRSRCTSSFSTS